MAPEKLLVSPGRMVTLTALKCSGTATTVGSFNKSVHYVEWANLQKKEFATVADAFKDLLSMMRCANPNCGGYVYVVPKEGRAGVPAVRLRWVQCQSESEMRARETESLLMLTWC